MNHTPVYIICSPRPRVGKTLLSRLLTEYLALENRHTTAFDLNLNEPSLLDFLPKLTETANIDDTFGQMQLMDRLIVHDGAPKVIDLGFHAFDGFFRMAKEIGFIKEAERRGVQVVILFIPDRGRTSQLAWSMLQADFGNAALVPVNNEQVLLGEVPPWIGKRELLEIAMLPGFLKTYIDRKTFSFASFLRTSTDTSSELYQWTVKCFVRFRELGLKLMLRRS
ncbi:hypothetical protein [Bradyrhizobium sp. LHD-71]|uniref:hypothetical protein n=1 Tax=Bradyrhizobium sp. LHD-71 TaxID=3072141 RepID=UPI00280D3376|nr:hypothetical protein [Bradyrhizobium sp. LHD-71]MDQ8730731.1 hypothetical protein [Bradyrhizobium sp. LHD-71]